MTTRIALKPLATSSPPNAPERVVIDLQESHYLQLKTPQETSKRRDATNKKLIGAAAFLLLLTAALVAVRLLTPASDIADAAATSLGLTIPNFADDHERERRAAEIQALASQIKNEKRTWRIGGVEYPFYDGPVPRPGSLAAKIQQDEIAQLAEFENSDTFALYTLVMQSRFDTIADYATFYDNATRFAPKPMSTDISDESFGAQRVSIKAFSLRAFRSDNDSLPRDPALTHASNVAEICGSRQRSVTDVAASNKLFVTDFSDFSQWSETSGAKYIASVVAYFCYNDEANELLPLAIRIVDTNVTYTPFDRPEEWTLAKMVADAAEISFQQMQHYADTHAVFLPLRVEALRNLASEHPVSALLLRASKLDLGLESLAARILLNTSTPLDMTFGFGAIGCTKFLGHQLAQLSMEHDFPTDIQSRGLEHLPIYKYGTYGQLHFDALTNMVRAYLKAYYPSDQDVKDDSELQNWAKAAAAIAQLRGFPNKFASLTELQKMLTHVLFQTFVRHHAMNGATSWESVSVPYSTPALWKKLPNRKLTEGETLNVLEYSTPQRQLPVLVVLSLSFNRHVPESESLYSLFNVSPFQQAKLAVVISDFENALKTIEAKIEAAEAGEKWPYLTLRPSALARSGWI